MIQENVVSVKEDFDKIKARISSPKIQLFKKIEDLKEIRGSIKQNYAIALLTSGKIMIISIEDLQVVQDLDFGPGVKSFIEHNDLIIVFGKGMKKCQNFIEKREIEQISQEDTHDVGTFGDLIFWVNGKNLKKTRLDVLENPEIKQVACRATHLAVNSRIIATMHKKEVLIFNLDLVQLSKVELKEEFCKIQLFEADILVAGGGRKTMNIYDYGKKKLHVYKIGNPKIIFSFDISEDMGLMTCMDKDISFFNIESLKDEAKLIIDNEMKKGQSINKSITFAMNGKIVLMSLGPVIYKIDLVEKYLIPKIIKFANGIQDIQNYGQIVLRSGEESFSLNGLNGLNVERTETSNELRTSRGIFSYSGNILYQNGIEISNVTHSCQILELNYVKGFIVSIDREFNLNILSPEGIVSSFARSSHTEFLGFNSGSFFFKYTEIKENTDQAFHLRFGSLDNKVNESILDKQASGFKQDSFLSSQIALQMIDICPGLDSSSQYKPRNIEGKFIILFNNSSSIISFNDWTLKIYDEPTSETYTKVTCQEALGEVISCFISDDDLFFYAATNTTLTIWSLYDYKYLGCIDYSSIEKIVVTSNSILITNQNQLQIYPNPTNPTSEISLLIPEKFSLKYWIGLNHLAQRSSQDEYKVYERYLNSSIILPNCFNLLHFFSYNSNELLIKKALKEECGFIRTTHKVSPIKILLEQKTLGLVDIFLKAFPRYLNSDGNILCRIENEMIDLNLKASSRLVMFYESFLQPAEQTLPKFGAPLAFGNNVKLSDSRFIDRNDFIKPSVNVVVPISGNNNKVVDLNIFINPEESKRVLNDPAQNVIFKDKVPILFKLSALKLPLKFGTQKSLDFLDSLLKSNVPEILATPIIVSILTSKWSKVWYWTLMQCLILGAILILLCVYIFYKESKSVVFYFVQILNVVNLVLESLQMSVGFRKYIKNYLNVLDFLRICSVLLFLIDLGEDSEKILLTYIVLLCWIKLALYLRMFNETRYFIYIVKCCARDIIPFLVILFYLNFAFAVCFFNLDSQKETRSYDSFIEALVHSYILNFNSFSIGDYKDAKEWIVFIVATVINPLILMNMIIALLGNTYSMVKEKAEIADMRELAEMIIEFESMLYWRRGDNERQFVQICSSVKENDSEQDDIKKTVKEISSNFIKTNDLLDSYNTKTQNNRNEIENLFNRVSDEFSRDLDEFEKSYTEDYLKVMQRFVN